VCFDSFFYSVTKSLDLPATPVEHQTFLVQCGRQLPEIRGIDTS
jgi:hypothetical protein